MYLKMVKSIFIVKWIVLCFGFPAPQTQSVCEGKAGVGTFFCFPLFVSSKQTSIGMVFVLFYLSYNDFVLNYRCGSKNDSETT